MIGMASVESILLVSKPSVVPLSYSLDDVIEADAVTRCKVSCLHLAFGSQSVNENCLQHVVEGQYCYTHFCGQIFDPPNLLKRVVSWRYLKPITASREVEYGRRDLRVVPCMERVPPFPRRRTLVQYTLVALALESRRQ